MAMSDPKADQQPSMEDILASIRKIIADDVGDVSAGAGARPDEDVLVLTRMLQDDGVVVDISTARSGRGTASNAPDRPAAKPRRDGVEAARRQRATQAADPLLSPSAAAIAEAAFDDLAGALQAAGGASIGGGRTLEDLVRDMLRPMLKDWLDRNLPALVERLVRQEIERVRRAAMRNDA